MGKDSGFTGRFGSGLKRKDGNKLSLKGRLLWHVHVWTKTGVNE